MSFLVKLLGIVDLIAVVAILAGAHLPQKFIIYSAGYLIAKGGFFGMTGSMLSWLDVVCGIFIILLAFGISFKIINMLILAFLIQKAFLSFI